MLGHKGLPTSLTFIPSSGSRIQCSFSVSLLFLHEYNQLFLPYICSHVTAPSRTVTLIFNFLSPTPLQKTLLEFHLFVVLFPKCYNLLILLTTHLISASL